MIYLPAPAIVYAYSIAADAAAGYSPAYIIAATTIGGEGRWHDHAVGTWGIGKLCAIAVCAANIGGNERISARGGGSGAAYGITIAP